MTEKKTRIRRITKGEIVVNDAFIIDKTKRMARVLVDMKTKRAEITSTGDLGYGPCISLSAIEDSVHVDESKRGIDTTIAFPDFIGWSIWCADVSKYDVTICFYRDNPQQ